MGAVYGKGFAAACFRAMELITILNRCAPENRPPA
jgi:hypothetical protein